MYEQAVVVPGIYVLYCRRIILVYSTLSCLKHCNIIVRWRESDDGDDSSCPPPPITAIYSSRREGAGHRAQGGGGGATATLPSTCPNYPDRTALLHPTAHSIGSSAVKKGFFLERSRQQARRESESHPTTDITDRHTHQHSTTDSTRLTTSTKVDQ